MKNILLVVVLTFLGGVSSAKGKIPDKEPGCMTNETFDEKKCREESSWVAIGKIVDVLPRRDEPDSSKIDFMEFRFIVQEWEKGKMKEVEIPHLRAFPLRMEWPSNTDGSFRLYLSKMILYNKPYKYRVKYIQRIKSGR
jgi:hypothetical protein